MAQAAICLIEDDPIMGESLVHRLALEGLKCDWFESGNEALIALDQKSYGLVLSDIKLPDTSGELVYAELIAKVPVPPPTIFITGVGTIDQAVRLLGLGASDYITKPFDIDVLMEKIRALLPALRDGEDEPSLGVSWAMRQVEDQLRKAAVHGASVVVTGESGVGKEFAARYYHQHTAQAQPERFVAINCAALSESMLEAELFGHERGAFTGAVKTHRGVFERAHGGTLFLDEIGEMPLEMQAKLLRVLQERRFVRVGGEHEIAVDMRVICASNRDLAALVAQGAFREDLFYRLNVLHVHIPPLRERHEDILWLARRMLATTRKSDHPCVLSPASERYLVAQPWPGNARELEHALQRACMFSGSDRIEPFAFGCVVDVPTRIANDPEGLKEFIQTCERNKIQSSLDEHDWRIAETAESLGISRKSLWEKMQRHQLSREGEGHQ